MSPLHISRASYKADRSLLRDVEGGKDYASVISDMTYGVTTQYFIFIICKDKPFTARARRTFTMLPEECAPGAHRRPRGSACCRALHPFHRGTGHASGLFRLADQLPPRR